MSQITSVYANIWRALFRVFNEVSWPAPPVNTQPVKVFLGGWGQDEEPVEGLLVITAFRPPESQEWKTTNFGRDEYLYVEVGVQTAIPGRTPEQVLDRLEELTVVVEQKILTTSQNAFQPPEVQAAAWWWQVDGIEGGIYPTSEGWAGGARFTIKVFARIGGT